jgi:hypothetical protein
MNTNIVEIIKTLTPIGIGVCSLLGVGSIGKIFLKKMEYRNDEHIRKEKRLSVINSNLAFYKKLFDKLAMNTKLWQSEQIKYGDAKNYDFSTKMTINDFDIILGESIVDFNNENGYLDIEEQASLKMPLQARGIY